MAGEPGLQLLERAQGVVLLRPGDDDADEVREPFAMRLRRDDFPEGAVLSTGTSLVPDLPFTLEVGDEIAITIPPLGELINPVVRGKAAVSAGKNAAQKRASIRR